jgi:hypothetical protein
VVVEPWDSEDYLSFWFDELGEDGDEVRVSVEDLGVVEGKSDFSDGLKELWLVCVSVVGLSECSA